MSGRSYFNLPSGYIHTFSDIRAYENPAVTICGLFEVDTQVKIIIIFSCTQVSVFLIRSALAYQFAILNVPEFGSVNFPTGKILSIEQVFLFRFPWQFFELYIFEPYPASMVL